MPAVDASKAQIITVAGPWFFQQFHPESAAPEGGQRSSTHQPMELFIS